MSWEKYNGEPLQESILDAVENAIIREVNNGIRLKVFIGTDSQVKRNTIEVATVIVFLREKKGGIHVYPQR